MKSKIITAFLLGAMAFGIGSFTTTPINAQSTSSDVSVNETQVNSGILTYYYGQFICFITVNPNRDYLLGGSNDLVNYPSNTLD